MRKKSEIVVKSNRLIEASYRLKLVEQQIILFAISRSRDEQVGLSLGQPVTIAAGDFVSMFGSNETKIYGQLKEAINDLFDRSVTIHDSDPETGQPRVVTTRWISDKAYVDRAGRIQLTFAPRVIPYITRLEAEFTSYRLEKIKGMSSAHAVRLYELLIQYLKPGKRVVELTWLKQTLGLENEYRAIKDFKKWVLDVAMRQINEHTDICVSYDQRKTGRIVTELVFKIKSSQPDIADRPKRKSKSSVDKAYIEQHAHPGESYAAAQQRLFDELPTKS